jgi:hypothetical protein
MGPSVMLLMRSKPFLHWLSDLSTLLDCVVVVADEDVAVDLVE